MRKTNWIILTVSAIFAVLLVMLWYYLDFDAIDAPLDLVLGIVWVVGVAIVAIVLTRLENKRRLLLRTMYVNGPLCFNTAVGPIPFEGTGDLVGKASQALDMIDYEEDPQHAPDTFKPAYTVVTDKYDSNKDTWRGKVVDDATGAEYGFDSAERLASILSRFSPLPAA